MKLSNICVHTFIITGKYFCLFGILLFETINASFYHSLLKQHPKEDGMIKYLYQQFCVCVINLNTPLF